MTNQESPQPECNSGAAALVDDVIEKAIKLSASDIHFEPRGECLKVRYRVDGLLNDSITIHKSMVASVIARIKVIVGLDLGVSRLSQDGRVCVCLCGEDIDLRVSTLPTICGEKIVIRLLKKNAVGSSFEDLGMEKQQAGEMLRMLKKQSGIILVTGPTGSGKTTTLYAALNNISSPEKNIVTIEDPVEYQIDGISQVQLNYKAGMTFAKSLRAVLRQDPDVIMVGEIRDSETAKIAVQAALTGHLVLSTLHTSSAAGAVERLCDMGVDKYLIASSLTAVLAQRLVRKSCPKCSKCSFSGYRGRNGIFELLIVTEKIKDLIHSSAGKNDIVAVSGMTTLYHDGLKKVIDNITTREELGRVLGDIEDII